MEKIRLDQFLVLRHPHYSRTRIQELIEEGFVLVDGQKRKPSFLLHGGEDIQMKRRAPEIPKAVPEDLPLNILHEDEDLIVINKAAGMVVHPAPGNFNGTVVNAVLHYLEIPSPSLGGVRTGKAESFAANSGEIRPGIVHRLDKGTSGVMVIAKNDFTLDQLSKQFKNRSVQKLYLALVFGSFPQKRGAIIKAIGRDTQHFRKFSSRTKKAREAVTHFEIEKQYEALTLLKLKPETGRTHQIRVHLSEFHHPIVGDTLYGAKGFISSIKDERIAEALSTLTRPLLHAAELHLTHPTSQKRLSFSAPLPNDFLSLLNFLGE